VPGVRSVYRWKGRVETAGETLLVVKTSAPRVRACLARLAQAHPYDVAEGVVLTASGALDAYVRWASEATKPLS
jgi:periplasmic divalent cation tolerance protein